MKAGPIRGVWRVGKNLWVGLYPLGLGWHIHLSSTGWFIPGNPKATQWAGPCLMDPKKFLHASGHERLRLVFDDGQEWSYTDPRTWGKWRLRNGDTPRQNEYFKALGPDWLQSPRAAAERLINCPSGRTVKEVMCDQGVAAGLGNYLTCEICWRAKVHPLSRWSTVEEGARRILVLETNRFLKECLEAKDHAHWRVFKRLGETCERCLTQIEYAKDPGGSRGSYYCPVCQVKIGSSSR